LTLWHPFIGKRVLESDGSEGGWDDDSQPTGDPPADLYEQAYAGYLPFIDDESDKSNALFPECALPREQVATPQLRRLFQETFSPGRTQPHRRPAMVFWALELARAFDLSLTCLACNMSYFADQHIQCPYCEMPSPAFAWVNTPRWKMCIPPGTTEFSLPHRLFYPFSLEQSNNEEYEATVDWAKKTVVPVRGTKQFPPELAVRFVEAAT